MINGVSIKIMFFLFSRLFASLGIAFCLLFGFGSAAQATGESDPAVAVICHQVNQELLSELVEEGGSEASDTIGILHLQGWLSVQKIRAYYAVYAKKLWIPSEEFFGMCGKSELRYIDKILDLSKNSSVAMIQKYLNSEVYKGDQRAHLHKILGFTTSPIMEYLKTTGTAS